MLFSESAGDIYMVTTIRGAERVVHVPAFEIALRRAAVNLALPLLAGTAGAIESAAATGDREKAGELLPELEGRFEQAEGAIRELLDIS